MLAVANAPLRLARMVLATALVFGAACGRSSLVMVTDSGSTVASGGDEGNTETSLPGGSSGGTTLGTGGNYRGLATLASDAGGSGGSHAVGSHAGSGGSSMLGGAGGSGGVYLAGGSVGSGGSSSLPSAGSGSNLHDAGDDSRTDSLPDAACSSGAAAVTWTDAGTGDDCPCFPQAQNLPCSQAGLTCYYYAVNCGPRCDCGMSNDDAGSPVWVCGVASCQILPPYESSI